MQQICLLDVSDIYKPYLGRKHVAIGALLHAAAVFEMLIWHGLSAPLGFGNLRSGDGYLYGRVPPCRQMQLVKRWRSGAHLKHSF